MKRFFKKFFIVTGMLSLFASPSSHSCAAVSNPANLHETALSEAAYAGDLRDQYRLGLNYLFNKNLNKQADAFFWIHSAADQGYAPAQFLLAWMLAKGIGGVEKDPGSSHNWLELAAKNGNKDAQEVLKGENFDKFIGVLKEGIKNN